MQTQTQDDLGEQYAAALRQIDTILKGSESDPAEMRKMLVNVANIANDAIYLPARLGNPPEQAA